MKMFFSSRRAMTATVIVSLILLLVGFILTLLVYTSFSWGDTVDRETCHQSVVLRAALPSTADVMNYAPLKCRTKKICVSEGGEKCNEETEPFMGVKGITKAKVEKKENIEKLISQEIVDCWTMMGEGKLPIHSNYLAENYGFGGVYSDCVICSRIAFAKDLKDEKGINLKEVNVLEYMRTYKIPGGEESYYTFLKGQTSVDVNFSKERTIEIQGSSNKKVGDMSEKEAKKVSVEEGSVPLKKINDGDFADPGTELAVLFMQISAPTVGDVWSNIGKAAIGGTTTAFLTAPKTTYAVAKGVGTLCNVAGVVSWVVCGGIAAIGGAALWYNVVDNQAITAGYCGDIQVGDKARSGCSAVRTVVYNESEIRKYCSVIESMP